jgi:cysteamine dioxygenase
MQQKLLNLIEQAKQTFGQGVPEDGPLLQSLRVLMDGLRAEDLELAARLSGTGSTAGWTSEELYVHPDFRLVLFVVAQGQAIPFHGHPLMTVLMKVLWGRIEIKAYDWAEEYPWTGLARCTYERTVDGAHETLLVLPKRGNVHRLTAVEECAFLDLLAPPYSEPEGRPCHYYREEKAFHLHGESLTRLIRE